MYTEFFVIIGLVFGVNCTYMFGEDLAIEQPVYIERNVPKRPRYRTSSRIRRDEANTLNSEDTYSAVMKVANDGYDNVVSTFRAVDFKEELKVNAGLPINNT